ncbi:MAG: anaerobic ribonucleoside-triphosphate reductase activating protein [Fusobacterium sp. JB019]|nr:anaerobic ribonucleoside-triphosphate reductase activating protein [Fusobacterium sp. JB020]MDP0505726.1 anaerobic ribonucleoside-triphosphate reductase activating protein [Fusobacterium sp. JB019]
MYYGNIKKIDIANGEGVRVSLFVSGCRNCCKNCFNPETWNFKYGQEFNLDTENEILNLLEQKHIKGLTVLGGEPFEPENQKDLLPFIKKVNHKFPHKDLWFFTGYIYDQDLVPNGKKYCEVTDELLSYIDVLVDGPFIEEEKDISLKFRGSKNQRIIYLKNK